MLKEFDLNLITSEARLLQDKENDILSKAKQIQKEMNQVREQKVQLLTNLFQEQLSKDMEKELENFKIKQEEEIANSLNLLKDENAVKLIKIQKLFKTVTEQKQTLDFILEDLKDKKDELESCHLAAIEYIKNNKEVLIEKYQEKLSKLVEQKVEKFKLQAAKQAM